LLALLAEAIQLDLSEATVDVGLYPSEVCGRSVL
jgi:hypothetical protein